MISVKKDFSFQLQSSQVKKKKTQTQASKSVGNYSISKCNIVDIQTKSDFFLNRLHIILAFYSIFAIRMVKCA